MSTETTNAPTALDEVEKDNTITTVWLNHKNWTDEKTKKVVPRPFPKVQAVRILKNQATQRGFQKAYTIAKVERGQ